MPASSTGVPVVVVFAAFCFVVAGILARVEGQGWWWGPVVYRARCATEPDAQPTNELRRRHGLPEVDELEIHRAIKPRWDRWQRREELEARRERRRARKQAERRAAVQARAR